jgi:excisionase family DNA binding protein
MIKIKIADIARTKGHSNAYALQRALDISPTMASRLWKGTFKQIATETINRLCELLDCEPSDLIVFSSDKSKAVKLVREPQAITMTGTVGTGEEMTTKQVADELGLKSRTVIDNIKSGRLKATKGKQGHNVIKRSDFEEFKKKRVATH